MKETDYNKYLSFLKTHKKLVGLSDWNIILSKKVVENNNVAEVEPDMYEKELEIKLSNTFHKLTHNKKKNVLLHELIHGRVEIFNKKKELVVEELEEELVNDLTRGFERHIILKC